MAESLGIVNKRGPRYIMANDPNATSFFSKDIDMYADLIIEQTSHLKSVYVKVPVDENSEEDDTNINAKQSRIIRSEEEVL